MTSSTNSSSNVSFFFYSGWLGICNGHVPGTRNAGNNLSVCNFEALVLTSHYLHQVLAASEHRKSLLLKEIVGTNPQGASCCYAWQVMGFYFLASKSLITGISPVSP